MTVLKKNHSSASIRQKLLLAFSVPVLLVFIVAILSYNNTQNMQVNSQWVGHTYEAIGKTQELLTLIVDMETGERGFLLTGKDEFLEPFYTSTGLWASKVIALKQLVSDNPSQIEKLSRVDMLYQSWRKQAVGPEIAKRIEVNKQQASMADVRNLIENKTGKKIIDTIREKIHEIITIEERLVSDRIAKTLAGNKTASASIIIGALATILFSVLAAIAVSNNIVNRLSFLLESIGSVSKGDYDKVELMNSDDSDDSDDSDEVGRLGKSFHEMAGVLQKREKELRESKAKADIVNIALSTANETLEERVELRMHDLTAALGKATKAEKLTAEARDLAEKANDAKGEFLASMSHEIRTPMNAVLGMTYLALKTDPNEKQREYLEKIQYSGEHLLRIINDILDFSKMGAGKMSLEIEDFDLTQLIDSVLMLVEAKAIEKNLLLAIDIDSKVPHQLRGDALRLSQVLINYINNAIKFTAEGSITIRVLLAESAGNIQLYFEVEDTGIGINEEELSRMFQLFEQADNSTTRKFGGTGLGLAISKQIAALMGGEVGVTSQLGTGSSFWFTANLQAAKGVVVKEVVPPQDLKLMIKALCGAYVLVVDDNTFNQEVTKGVLDDIGVKVMLAENGAEALELMKQTPFDCVLMDIHMPVMDGIVATRHIRADEKLAETIVIAMTANARLEDQNICIEAGMNAVVIKPFNVNHLFATMAKCMPADVVNVNKAAPASDAYKSTTDGLPVMQGFDTATALERMDGNTTMYRRFLTLFQDRNAGMFDNLRVKLDHGDNEAAKLVAHSMKGGAGTIGAVDLQVAAMQLEGVLKAGVLADQVLASAEFITLEKQWNIAITSLATITQGK